MPMPEAGWLARGRLPSMPCSSRVNGGGLGADLLDDARDQAFILLQQSQENMRRLDGAVVMLAGDALRFEHGVLRFVGVTAEIHMASVRN